ncbi:helix-turn-helix transcriptional regulator [Diaphorobacter ruginosibacter]|uniref:Helix-turn-helix transcriptional regulator n=1 Tax=Diaphorobacter ruginosibacter TaxID=1715720 RepID=A0A7G9RIB7_9BURK|nr:helix-turn-helix transcriptional regulator [Diaphorobacter ruginosibacter]QNN55342.1 helix-turn-helix transcriptional regulator [Diaphorobacter ruginosibacter]
MPDLMHVLGAYMDSADGPSVMAATRVLEQELSSETHRHARGQLFGSIKGLISVHLDEGVWIVPAIHAVWIPPHHAHSGRSYGPYHGWSAYIAEAACASLPKQPCTIRVSGLLREAVLRLASLTPEAAVSPSEAQLHICAVVLDEIRGLPVEEFGLPFPRDARLQRIARALMANPADPRDMEDWADFGAISSRTLSRRFVTETGFNFTSWRQRVRLLRSLEMLAEGMSVTAIALDLGYASVSAYIGLFRRTFGQTPASYRLRARAL